MMRRLCVGLLLIGLLTVLFIGAGCLNPPDDTMYVDINGPLQPGGKRLAWDKDHDGKPDKDPNGEILLVENSEGYETAEQIDAVAPPFLQMLGSLGVGAAAVIGIAWKRLRFGRSFMNGVMAWQEVRNYLHREYEPELLAEVDNILGDNQKKGTEADVTKVKTAIGLHLPTL